MSPRKRSVPKVIPKHVRKLEAARRTVRALINDLTQGLKSTNRRRRKGKENTP